MTLPLIAVTGRRLPAKRIERWRNDGVVSPVGYTDSVERAGGYGVLLPPVAVPSARAAAERLAPFAGLVLTGGTDVDPGRYGAERDPHTYGLDDLVDGHELALLGAALDADLPVLAICRGIQVLNVALGGTLHQHIPDLPGLRLHGVPDGGGGSLGRIDVDAGTRLAKALGTDVAEGMCHHHQAIDRLGTGLTVTAEADDGIIEGVELDGRSWVVGVQWHPEDTAADDPVQQSLFDAFVAQTRP